MDWRNRIGLYGAYFCGMAGIGFTLPYLPLYLRGEGFSDRAISFVSALAALVGVTQFPIGLWSDRLRRRKPFLVALLAVLALATVLLPMTHGLLLVSLLVLLVAENGVCRATVESLAGAEATQMAPPDGVGAALGALRVWRPTAIVVVALASIGLSGVLGVRGLLMPLAVVQGLAVVLALLIREEHKKPEPSQDRREDLAAGSKGLGDATLWVFVAAMVLFHFSNAPGGVYLGLFMKQELGTSEGLLPVAFVVSMVVWMLAVQAGGRLADRIGRRPLLITAWAIMTARLLLLAVAQATWQALAIQVLDGLGQALFAVLAAAWVTDRLGDPRKAGEAQVLVGSALVFGSAVGPAVTGFVVDALGYRGTFAALGGVGAVATLLVIGMVPETLKTGDKTREALAVSESG
ncbi:MAG: MFS transporter [Isosphaeraceae bacterium]